MHPSEDPSIKWLRVCFAFGVLDLYGGYYDASQAPACAEDSARSAATCGDAAPATSSGRACDSDESDCVQQDSNAPQAEQHYARAASLTSAAAAKDAKDAEGPMVHIPMGHGSLCDLPVSYLFPLSNLDTLGADISVPRDVTGVLRYRYGDTFMIPRYMDKGRDSVEQGKLYARILGILGKAGLKI